jgi:hypothetical protein
MSDYDELRGVEGWLMFFLVTLAVLTPVFLIIGAFIQWEDASTAYRIYPGLGAVDIGSAALIVILAWFAAYRLTAVFNRTSVHITISILWIIALIYVLVQPILVGAVTGLSVGDVLSAAGPEQFRPLGYATIWTAYLLTSKRVRNTYGAADAPLDEGSSEPEPA